MARIAIIGAGGAGLSAGRHCLKQNIPFDIFEQTGNVGGTWHYTDCVGMDENGLPVHSAMYQGLKTNLPKEVMTFENFPYPNQKQSYLPQEEIINYLRNFSKSFHVQDHIKFWKRVVRVVPQEHNSWMIEYEDVRSKQKCSNNYKAVMICNGHHAFGFIPEIKGIEYFKHHYRHSHDYRKPDIYTNKNVLIIGSGPSGCDIAQKIATVAKKIYVSHRGKCFQSLPETITQTPSVKEFISQKVIFKNGNIVEIDEIIFCTGYRYDFPFMSELCKIQVTEHCVYPLYQHIINVEFPTMGFIGLNVQVCPFPLFDIQVRFFLSTISGHYKLPSKSEMLKNIEDYIKTNSSLKNHHTLGENQGAYFEELAKEANIKPIPSVIQNLYLRIRQRRNSEECFRICDEEHWEQII